MKGANGGTLGSDSPPVLRPCEGPLGHSPLAPGLWAALDTGRPLLADPAVPTEAVLSLPWRSTTLTTNVLTPCGNLACSWYSRQQTGTVVWCLQK